MQPREASCRAVSGRRELKALLAASPELQKLGAAARMRGAARLLAQQQVDDARTLLDGVPEHLRGTSWSILAAWGARLGRDPVEASRLAARVGSETLDRLRTSGNEDLGRLVSHALAP